MRVVKHRGPRRFSTEFEKALFAAHVGTIVSESLLENVPCYLEEPKWMALYLGLAQASDFLTDRHPLTLNIRAAMFKLPGKSIEREHACPRLTRVSSQHSGMTWTLS